MSQICCTELIFDLPKPWLPLGHLVWHFYSFCATENWSQSCSWSGKSNIWNPRAEQREKGEKWSSRNSENLDLPSILSHRRRVSSGSGWIFLSSQTASASSAFLWRLRSFYLWNICPHIFMLNLSSVDLHLNQVKQLDSSNEPQTCVHGFVSISEQLHQWKSY